MSRLALLRQRAGSKGPFSQQQATGLFRAEYPDMAAHPVRVRWVKLPKPTGRGYVSLGMAIPRKVPVWVKLPDEGANELVPVTKRREGVSPLVTMAKVLLRKRKRGETWAIML